MIADLHCHYPMHLFPEDVRPRGDRETWLERLRNVLQSGIVDIAALLANDRYVNATWRVNLEGLEDGGANLVCSVLYWPPAEFDFAVKYGSPPLREYFEDVQYQIKCVEEDLERQNKDKDRVRIAKRAADLEDKNHILFVHCLEGALQLGPGSPQEIDDRIRWLAEQGVYYITVAHLFYRQVATNAPAIDIPDWIYKMIFHQPGEGLTDLGRAVIEAMHKYRVAIDLTHMSEEAIKETLDLVKKLDGDKPVNPCPVIATHVAMREVGPDDQEYNLLPETAKAIHDNGGLIGLIMAQRQLGATPDEQRSKELVCEHIKAIYRACGDDASAIGFGTDMDGFIKPTIEGVQSAADLVNLTRWVKECREREGDADKILYGNALRVIKQTFESRERAFAELGLQYPPAA